MKRNLRLSIFAISTAVLIAMAALAHARVERRVSASAARHISVMVDSIDYRADLTRIYGRLAGRPHTSQRIDRVTLSTAGTAPAESTDIDGIDLKRWFQWEEDGIIPVEIDFPPMRRAQVMTLTVETPRGTDRITLKTANTPGK